MGGAQSRIIALIAVGQFLPLVLFPWSASVSSIVFIAVLLLLCAGLGWSLFQHKAWGRKLTIFVQGFNVIIRVITIFANMYRPDVGLNVPLVLAYAVSITLSVVILSYIDKSEVQLAFES
jgi:hypothetical protein